MSVYINIRQISLSIISIIQDNRCKIARLVSDKCSCNSVNRIFSSALSILLAQNLFRDLAFYSFAAIPLILTVTLGLALTRNLTYIFYVQCPFHGMSHKILKKLGDQFSGSGFFQWVISWLFKSG